MFASRVTKQPLKLNQRWKGKEIRYSERVEGMGWMNSHFLEFLDKRLPDLKLFSFTINDNL